jgi:hypothetical protein
MSGRVEVIGVLVDLLLRTLLATVSREYVLVVVEVVVVVFVEMSFRHYLVLNLKFIQNVSAVTVSLTVSYSRMFVRFSRAALIYLATDTSLTACASIIFANRDWLSAACYDPVTKVVCLFTSLCVCACAGGYHIKI